MTIRKPHPWPPDALIDEVRRRRQDLLASCDDDLSKLAEVIRRREADHPERVMDPRAQLPSDRSAHPR